MKYLRHFFVDAKTEEPLLHSNHSSNGKKHPNIKGLNTIFWTSTDNGIDMMLSTADDGAETGDAAFEISKKEWMNLSEKHFNSVRDDKILQVYEVAKRKIENAVDKKYYEDIEISFSLSDKVEQARIADSKDSEEEAQKHAPMLAIEANSRQMSVKDLAVKIKDNKNNVSNNIVKINGYRGYLVDQLNSISFNKESVDKAFESFSQVSNFDIKEDEDWISLAEENISNK